MRTELCEVRVKGKAGSAGVYGGQKCRNAEEMMANVAQTSALRHVTFGLSGWQLLPGLSLEPTRAPSLAQVGPPHSGSLVLFESQSIGQ
ncbi:hypothetical protein DVH24_002762 [Malus domestica]|uniref:Uncharacterized protein n=1 Tax=Malus domestica TaxID=3750 RepID=A0A498K8P8_MALDO|nr:hypothetical protein DVH24_002762 [Malus domestica]